VCGGVQIHLTDPEAYKPCTTTLALIQDCISLYPDQFSWRTPPYEYETEKMPIDLIIGDKSVRARLEKREDIHCLEESWQEELNNFRETAQRYFLYP